MVFVFHSVNVYCVDFFYVEPSLHSMNRSHWVMVYNYFHAVEFDLRVIFKEFAQILIKNIGL